jgi:hypothetical protein
VGNNSDLLAQLAAPTQAEDKPRIFFYVPRYRTVTHR